MDKSFLFEEPVGILPKHGGPDSYREPVELSIRLLQNAYEVRCQRKEYAFPTLSKAITFVKEKLEMYEKEAGEEKSEKSDSES